MSASLHERKRRLVICAVGSLAAGLLFLISLVFTVPLYLRMRGFATSDGSFVMYSHEQYAELLQSTRIMFFVLLPLLGMGLFFTAWMIWRAAKFMEPHHDTPV